MLSTHESTRQGKNNANQILLEKGKIQCDNLKFYICYVNNSSDDDHDDDDYDDGD